MDLQKASWTEGGYEIKNSGSKCQYSALYGTGSKTAQCRSLGRRISMTMVKKKLALVFGVHYIWKERNMIVFGKKGAYLHVFCNTKQVVTPNLYTDRENM